MDNTNKIYSSINRLESALGDPNIHDNFINFKDVIDYDERRKFPTIYANKLDEIGVNKFFIPTEIGGNLSSFEELSILYRSIFRRDATLAMGYGITTFMAAINVWLFGKSHHKRHASNSIKQGNRLSVAYHEKMHGNDVLNNDCAVSFKKETAYLNGRKWLINNIDNSESLLVFARTSNKALSRDFSLFYFSKEAINAYSINYLEKINTLGLRGCHLSGIEFNNTKIPIDSLVGELGYGYEYTLKAFQVTRTVLPSMALGMLDTALRTVTQFLSTRILYKRPAIHLQHVRESLVSIFTKLLICDCVSVTAARMLHVVPQQMSLCSSIVKHFVPTYSQECLKRLSVLLGARGYIREGQHAIFQKILRDYPVVTIGHANSNVCLSMIIPQLNALLEINKDNSLRNDKLELIFNWENELPEFSTEQLSISNKGTDDILMSLVTNSDQLLSISNFEDKEKYLAIEKYIDFIIKKTDELKIKIKQLSSYRGQNIPTELFNCAESYCNYYVSAICIHFYIKNKNKKSALLNNENWLILALHELFPYLDFFNEIEIKKIRIEFFEKFINFFESGDAFSLLPIQYSEQ